MKINFNFLDKIGFINYKEIIYNRLNTQKNDINIFFIEFNIYQILSYLIFSAVNKNNKLNKVFCLNNKNNLCIFTNSKNKISFNSNSQFRLINTNKIDIITRNFIIPKNFNCLFSINNLNKSKKYLLFLKCNGTVKESNCIYINNHKYLFFYAYQANNIKFTLNINSSLLISDSYLCEFFDIPKRTQSICSYIFGCKFKIPKNEYDLTKCIAVWNRSELLSNILNQENEYKTNYTYNTILGYSQNKDIDSIIDKTKNLKNIYYFYTPNSPLGLKWQHIIEFTKIFKNNNILIQGSDDLILMNNLNKELIYKYDFIGQISWYIKDNNNNKKFLCRYKSSKKFIGTGRIVNNNVLNNNNYNIFNCHLFKKLDHQLNYLSKNINNKLISNPICYSIKNEIECINPLKIILKNKYIKVQVI